KARTRGVHRGFGGGDTFLFLLARKLDDEDGVLGGQADENDEADLRQDVDGHAPREQACYRGEQAHRHDQDDCQRQLPAFVLRDEDEEDEKGGCAENEESRWAALLLLESEVGPLKGNAFRKNLAGKLLHAMQCRTSGDARRRYPLHLGGGEQIVARHAVRDRFASELRHCPDWDHFTGRVAGFQTGNVLRGASEFSITLDTDLVGAAKIVEVVNVL